MDGLGLKNSLFISIAVHSFIFIVFSLVIMKNPFEISTQPIMINIQSESDSLAAGVGEIINQPGRKSVPHLNERVTHSIEKTAVPEKTVPNAEVLRSFTREKDTAKSLLKTTSKPNIKKELAKEKNQKKEREINENNKPAKTPEKDLAEEIEKEKVNQQLNQISGDIDKALDEDGGQNGKEGNVGTAHGDPLGDADWGVKPRKTVYFPDIQSKIPEKYKKKGMGYSITARIDFDKNGLATRVDIITSSGEPNIDSIFFSELRKIRVEAIEVNRTDEITKTFTISLK
jgi:hypothetical protein